MDVLSMPSAIPGNLIFYEPVAARAVQDLQVIGSQLETDRQRGAR
jgi:hypothetical protein